MDNPADSRRKGKLNAKTFAVRDERGNIFVTVPVLVYKNSNDAGYKEMAGYFPDTKSGTTGTTFEAVSLSSDWCDILPLNSSTNDGMRGDDD